MVTRQVLTAKYIIPPIHLSVLGNFCLLSTEAPIDELSLPAEGAEEISTSNTGILAVCCLT